MLFARLVAALLALPEFLLRTLLLPVYVFGVATDLARGYYGLSLVWPIFVAEYWNPIHYSYWDAVERLSGHYHACPRC